MTFPMSNLYYAGGKEIPCVAKYPLAAWAGQPEGQITFDIHTRATMCIAMAEKDMGALFPLYQKACEIKNTPVERALQVCR